MFQNIEKILVLQQVTFLTGNLQGFFQYFKQNDITFLRFKEQLHKVVQRKKVCYEKGVK